MRFLGQTGFGMCDRRLVSRRWRWVSPMTEILEGRQLLSTILVNTTGDADGADGSSTLSLRQAIEISNGTLAIGSLSTDQAALVSGSLSTPNTIDFAIPGTGPFTISPSSPLPAIANPVTIDGYSQPGSHPNTNETDQADNAVLLIDLNGSAVPSNGSTKSGCLILDVGGITVQGLDIGGFTYGDAILVQAADTGGDLIQGNFVGTDPTGTIAVPNLEGVYLSESYASTIGGTAAASRNIFSGNSGNGININGSNPTSDANLVEGNFVGIDASGTRALGNENGITIFGGLSDTIGGTTPEARNVISGNVYSGLAFIGLANVVEGDYIGTDITGTQALANGTGISVLTGSTNTIGGTAEGASNVISGNTGDGLTFSFAGTSTSPGNSIEGNLIGIDATATNPLGNGGDGIDISAGNFNTIGGTTAGAANVIAFNGKSGVVIEASEYGYSQFETISGNSIYGNGGLGIDLGNDGVTPNNPTGSPTSPNFLQPYPVLTSTIPTSNGTVISGTLDAAPSTSYTVEFFANPTADPSGYGQGETYLGSTVATTDASGHAAFSFDSSLNLLGQYVSANATDSQGNTSEFASDIAVPFSLTTTTLAGPSALTPLGQNVTITATVTTASGAIPTGTVNFDVDQQEFLSAPIQIVNGVAQAVITLDGLSAGLHAVIATYPGDSESASSVSPVLLATVSVPVVPPPPTVEGPLVVAIQRFGYHTLPTSYVITFNEPLDPATAQDISNYQIIGPDGVVEPIKAAVYNPASMTVTLYPRKSLDIHAIYQITLIGTGPGGITSASGLLLDGPQVGTAGTNYVGLLEASQLVLGEKVPGGPEQLAKLKRELAQIEANQAKELAKPNSTAKKQVVKKSLVPVVKKVVHQTKIPGKPTSIS
jgi:hypothetical protein